MPREAFARHAIIGDGMEKIGDLHDQLRLVAPYPRKIMRALYLFLVSKVMVQTDKP